MRKQASLVVGAVVLLALILVGVVAVASNRQLAAASQDAAMIQATGTPEAEATEEAADTPEAIETEEASPTAPAAQMSTGTAYTSMPRYITVVGQGKTQVMPDIAVINVGVNTSAAKVTDATDENDTIMAAILKALADKGIAEKDIQTSNYNIYFDEGPYGPEMGTREPVYRVSNMVIVTIRDVAAVSEILDAVIAAGANSIYGVNFTVEKWTEAESEARALAMKDAQARAQELATLAGVELGEVISVSEVVGAVPLQPYVAMERAVAMGGGGAPISPGQLEYSTSIQVTYAIK